MEVVAVESWITAVMGKLYLVLHLVRHNRLPANGTRHAEAGPAPRAVWFTPRQRPGLECAAGLSTAESFVRHRARWYTDRRAKAKNN
jgi:hypothetical protein